MASANQKLKLMYMARIFQEETDENHGLTRQQITDRLAALDIKLERKTFYNDIECLKSFGLDIIRLDNTRPAEYSMVSRSFESPELLLMTAAIQSSQFLTSRKAKQLAKKITALGSKHTGDIINKSIHVEGRIKNQNESIFYLLDAIQRAFMEKRKIEFTYFKYDVNKKRVKQHNGDTYVRTPVQLMYMDSFYYLIVWDEKHQDFGTYRVDRMGSVKVSNEPAEDNEEIRKFDVGKFQQRIFGMYSGEPVNVKLRVQEWAMGGVIDRFGKDVASRALNDREAQVCVTVMKAGTFYGWLATYGDGIVIEEPASLKEDYLEYLRNIANAYGEKL